MKFTFPMFTEKHFKTRAALNRFVEKNESRFQIEEIAVNNGFAVIYRKLLSVRMPR